MRWRILAAASAVAALMLAGCGDDSDDGGDATSTTTTTAGDTDATATTTTAGGTTTDETTTTSSPEDTESTTTTGPDDGTDEPVDDVARLSGLPWANPDDAHADPIAAVEAFLGFAGDLHAGGSGGLELAPPVVGEYAAGDQRSGEVEVTFAEEAGPPTVTPTVTVFVRQPEPDGPWWVVGAASAELTVDQPTADATIGSAFDLVYTNEVITGRNRLAVYADGSGEPLYAASSAGSGVFASGEFSTRIDLASCEDTPALGPDAVVETVFTDVSPCDGPGPAGSAGTVVLVHDFGVTTVPVMFADSGGDS